MPTMRKRSATGCVLLCGCWIKPSPNNIQAIHRIRSELVQQRHAKPTRLSLLAIRHRRWRRVDASNALPQLLESAENGLTADFRVLLDGLRQDLMTLDERVMTWTRK